MIMTGTASRTLGGGGALLLLSAASLLLPINPSWAQRSEEEQRTIIVVADGENESDAKDQAVTITSPDGKTALSADSITVKIDTQAAKGGKDGAPKPAAGTIKTKPLGMSQTIKASSIDQAINILEEKSKLAAKNTNTEEARAIQETLGLAIKALKEASKSEVRTVRGRNDGATREIKLAAETIARIQKRAGNADSRETPNPELEAKVMKAKERVNTIQRELESKRQELMKAEHELSAIADAEFAKTLKVHQLEIKPIQVERRVSDRRDKAKIASEDLEREGRRLEQLESKLRTLMEEVEKLKKDKKPETRGIDPDSKPFGATER